MINCQRATKSVRKKSWYALGIQKRSDILEEWLLMCVNEGESSNLLGLLTQRHVNIDTLILDLALTQVFVCSLLERQETHSLTTLITNEIEQGRRDSDQEKLTKASVEVTHDFGAIVPSKPCATHFFGNAMCTGIRCLT